MPKKDIFDRIGNLDLLDRVELPLEEKVIYSPEMQKAIDSAVQEQINKLPLDKMIARVVDQQVQEYKERLQRETVKNQESEDSLKQLMLDTVKKAKEELSQKMETLDEQMDGIDADAEKVMERMRSKYDELINKVNYEAPPQYQFGGYPPPGGGLPVIGTAGLTTWRIITTGDNDLNLSVQRLEDGIWVEKGSFQ